MKVSAYFSLSVLGLLALLPPVHAAEEISLAEFEKQAAEAVGGPPNPTVLKWTEPQYFAAINQLHPAFRLTPELTKAAIQYGTSRKSKRIEEVTDRWDRVAGANKAFALTRGVVLAFEGWDAARTYQEPDWKALEQWSPDHYLPFVIRVLRSSAKEVQNLRFVLETDDGKHYQPVAEPLASEVNSTVRDYSYTLPEVRTNQGQGAVISGGRVTPYSYKTTGTYWRTYYGSDVYYRGAFQVSFDLLNPDGTPRIPASAKECTLLIIGDGRERRIKFRLAEWLPPVSGSKGN